MISPDNVIKDISSSIETFLFIEIARGEVLLYKLIIYKQI